MEELERLQERLRMLIHNTCNTIGCKECPYKWDGGCSSDTLQNKILDIDISQENKKPACK